MSWLEDLHKERVFNYTDITGETLSGNVEELSGLAEKPILGEPGESFMYMDHVYFYNGFDSIKPEGMTVVSFEKNGRKAYQIKDSSGKIRYIAKSKHEYLKHGEIDGKKLTRKGKATPLKGEPE
jgi:hypothetical protein